MGLLIKSLSDLHIHPYYVYACDLVAGTEDLRVPLHEVCQIEKEVRGITAGYNNTNANFRGLSGNTNLPCALPS